MEGVWKGRQADLGHERIVDGYNIYWGFGVGVDVCLDLSFTARR